ncbi:hypothetical protein ACMD2_24432, partial [Ananas comosus]
RWARARHHHPLNPNLLREAYRVTGLFRFSPLLRSSSSSLSAAAAATAAAADDDDELRRGRRRSPPLRRPRHPTTLRFYEITTLIRTMAEPEGAAAAAAVAAIDGMLRHCCAQPTCSETALAVWNDFTKERRADGSFVAVCHHCKRQLTASSRSGTTHLKNHLATCLSQNACPNAGSFSSAASSSNPKMLPPLQRRGIPPTLRSGSQPTGPCPHDRPARLPLSIVDDVGFGLCPQPPTQFQDHALRGC